MSNKFQRAKRTQSRLRLALTGPSGSGKTLGALMIAQGIGGRIAVIDTERGSASLYAEPIRLANGSVFAPPEFDSMDLEPPYSPERYIDAVASAESDGYDILIIDSISHEWSGVGGCLDILDDVARARYRGNTWSAWSEITPRHRMFLDRIVQSRMHIIATMRSKTETAQSDSGGKKTVTKLGMKSEQRDGAEYEFTSVLDIVHDGHLVTVSKDRTGLFGSLDPHPITADLGRTLRAWLDSGATPPAIQIDVPRGTQPPVISAAELADLDGVIQGYDLPRERIEQWVLRAWGIQGLENLPASRLPILMKNIDKWASESYAESAASDDRTDRADVF